MSERPLEIAFIANGFPPGIGGTELYNAEYARRLHERGHRVRVFTWGRPTARGSETDAMLPIEIHREPLVARGREIDPRGLDRALERWQSEVAFVSRGSRKLRRIVRVSSRRLPVVLSIHELSRRHRVRRRVAGWRIRRLYGLRWADYVTVNSEDTRSRLLELGIAEERLAVVHPGVDTSRFTPDPEAGSRARRELGLTGSSVLLTVSRLAPHKGQERIIAALPGLRAKIPKLVYLIVGEGRMRAALEHRAAELGVADMVRFTGFVPDVRRYYHACDVFAMASSRASTRAKAGEGFGISYVEAGACGKPVVASTQGGGAEIVVDGVTGRVVDPQDPEQLEAALVELLADPEKARELGARARQRVQRYDWNHGTRELERVLRAAASRRPRPAPH